MHASTPSETQNEKKENKRGQKGKPHQAHPQIFRAHLKIRSSCTPTTLLPTAQRLHQRTHTTCPCAQTTRANESWRNRSPSPPPLHTPNRTNRTRHLNLNTRHRDQPRQLRNTIRAPRARRRAVHRSIPRSSTECIRRAGLRSHAHNGAHPAHARRGRSSLRISLRGGGRGSRKCRRPRLDGTRIRRGLAQIRVGSDIRKTLALVSWGVLEWDTPASQVPVCKGGGGCGRQTGRL